MYTILNILLMDDDAEFAFELRSWLEKQGHMVTWCRCTADAIILLKADTFQLVITDIYIRENGLVIPDGGISLINELRIYRAEDGARQTNHIPIIAISSAVNYLGNKLALNTALNVGAHYALPKPLDYTKLAACMEKLLAKDDKKGGAARLRKSRFQSPSG